MSCSVTCIFKCRGVPHRTWKNNDLGRISSCFFLQFDFSDMDRLRGPPAGCKPLLCAASRSKYGRQWILLGLQCKNMGLSLMPGKNIARWQLWISFLNVGVQPNLTEHEANLSKGSSLLFRTLDFIWWACQAGAVDPWVRWFEDPKTRRAPPCFWVGLSFSKCCLYLD